MEDLKICGGKVSWQGNLCAFAIVYADYPCIYLFPVPKEAFENVERGIGAIIEHETIHIVLERTMLGASDWFDYLYRKYGSNTHVEI